MVKQSCVAGFVKGPVDNKDKSLTFWIAGQRFVVATKSAEAKKLLGARRALILFHLEASTNPRITMILVEPSARSIIENMRDCATER